MIAGRIDRKRSDSTRDKDFAMLQLEISEQKQEIAQVTIRRNERELPMEAFVMECLSLAAPLTVQ